MGDVVRAWAALRARFSESRFELSTPADFGRKEELEILMRGWSMAKSSEGQVVLLSGEAGSANRCRPQHSWKPSPATACAPAPFPS
jgi:hypothetical protein